MAKLHKALAPRRDELIRRWTEEVAQRAADQMFAPYVQVGENRSGFGLGLAIARQAVQAHGGAILVKDRPGDGCTFVIELTVV